MLSRAEFDRCLLSWIQSLHEATDGQVIVIDGKTLRDSFDKASNKSAIHMISAWASANSISLGQSPTVPVRQRHSTNTGHGRRESRWHYVCGVPRDLPDRDRWPVDVTFREDHCRIRKGNADANFSILRRIALMLLKNEKTAKRRSEEQAAFSRLGRRLPAQSPCRLLSYGAIALRETAGTSGPYEVIRQCVVTPRSSREDEPSCVYQACQLNQRASSHPPSIRGMPRFQHIRTLGSVRFAG